MVVQVSPMYVLVSHVEIHSQRWASFQAVVGLIHNTWGKWEMRLDYFAPSPVYKCESNFKYFVLHSVWVGIWLYDTSKVGWHFFFFLTNTKLFSNLKLREKNVEGVIVVHSWHQWNKSINNHEGTCIKKKTPKTFNYIQN